MMVNENVNMVAETKKFMDALDSFYGLEPLRIYDFLLFFYFANSCLAGIKKRVGSKTMP